MLQGSLGVFLENGYTNMIYVARSFFFKKTLFLYMFAMACVNLLGCNALPSSSPTIRCFYLIVTFRGEEVERNLLFHGGRLFDLSGVSC